MITKSIAFRIPIDLYETFQKRCSDEGAVISEKLRNLINDYLYPPNQSQIIKIMSIEPVIAKGFCQVCKGKSSFAKISFTLTGLDEIKPGIKCLQCNTLFEVKLEKLVVSESRR